MVGQDALAGLGEVNPCMQERPWLVAMLGARMHYAVPRVLHAAGILERLFTDIDCRSVGLRWLRSLPDTLGPRPLRRILSRHPEGVPEEETAAFNTLGIIYGLRRSMIGSRSGLTRLFLRTNRDFCRRVCRQGWGNARAAFTFNCAGLEILEQAKGRGMRTASEQTIAPAAVEHRLLQEECMLHPGWESPEDDRFADEYIQREQEEWALADTILCGSEFVREGVRECGGPIDRCIVIPYGVDGREPQAAHAGRQSRSKHPLRVLTVGTLSLRRVRPMCSKQHIVWAGKRRSGWWGHRSFLEVPRGKSALR